MFDIIIKIIESLKGVSPAQKAKLSAYLFAPVLILGMTGSGLLGGAFAIDLGRPVTVTELRTEISPNGSTVLKPGFALIVEPVSSEYRIQVESLTPRIWTSLDEQAAYANRGQLALDSKGLTGKAPFLGVNEPVTVVVEGRLGNSIQLPGGSVKADNWQLPSHRSDSILSSVLFVCVFAFGMSLATGLPSLDRNEQTAG